MSKDIMPILEGWEFIPNEITVRKIKGLNGRDKIQLRLDLGVMQMELDGRPDGKRPFGKKSLLEHYESIIQDHIMKFGTDENFRLDTNDCFLLQNESIQYYHRYLSLMRLGDFARVARDTARNIKVFDLVKKFAATDDDRWAFEQYRPYVLMMLTRAKCTLSLEAKDFDQALKYIDEGIEKIRAFYDEYEKADDSEKSFEIEFLASWAEEIQQLKPISYPERLKKELDDAVRRENYELAAQLRDKIRRITR